MFRLALVAIAFPQQQRAIPLNENRKLIRHEYNQYISYQETSYPRRRTHGKRAVQHNSCSMAHRSMDKHHPQRMSSKASKPLLPSKFFRHIQKRNEYQYHGGQRHYIKRSIQTSPLRNYRKRNITTAICQQGYGTQQQKMFTYQQVLHVRIPILACRIKRQRCTSQIQVQRHVDIHTQIPNSQTSPPPQ